MNEIDWVTLGVLFLSTILGVSRGVVREILAIVGWLVAIFLALRFSPQAAPVILPFETVSLVLRTALASVIIVVATLFGFGILGKLMSRLLAVANISFEDRAIGAVFGLMRGIVIVCLCVFIMGMTAATKTSYWRNSVFVVPAERIIDFSMPFLPQAIADMRTGYRVH